MHLDRTQFITELEIIYMDAYNVRTVAEHMLHRRSDSRIRKINDL